MSLKGHSRRWRLISALLVLINLLGVGAAIRFEWLVFEGDLRVDSIFALAILALPQLAFVTGALVSFVLLLGKRILWTEWLLLAVNVLWLVGWFCFTVGIGLLRCIILGVCAMNIGFAGANLRVASYSANQEEAKEEEG